MHYDVSVEPRCDVRMFTFLVIYLYILKCNFILIIIPFWDNNLELLEALVISSEEIELEVNADRAKYMFKSRDQNAGRSHNIKVDNTSFERVEEVKYLGTTLTGQNSIQKEIKSILKSGNACYHSVQNLLSSSFEYKKIKTYRTISCPVVLYGYETWSLTLREERRLRVFENRVLRIFGPKREKVTGEWRKLHNEKLNNRYSTQYYSGAKIENKIGGAYCTYEESRGVYRVLVGKPEGKRPFGKPRHTRQCNIKMSLQKVG